MSIIFLYQCLILDLDGSAMSMPVFSVLRLLAGIHYVTFSNAARVPPTAHKVCSVGHIMKPFAICGSIARSKEDDPVGKTSYRERDLSATSTDKVPDQDICVRSFRDPWQTQLVHLDCKLEDVIETVLSR
jgi:hypothetical protein